MFSSYIMFICIAFFIASFEMQLTIDQQQNGFCIDRINPILHISNCRKGFDPAGRLPAISHGVSCAVHPAYHLKSIDYSTFEIADFKTEQSNFLPWDLGEMRTLERRTQSSFDGITYRYVNVANRTI